MNKFIEGDIVVISKESEYYGRSTSNPDDSVKGTVSRSDLSSDPQCYSMNVNWDNGTSNSYKISDLILADESEEAMEKRKILLSIVFDETKIYLHKDIEVHDLKDLFTKLLLDKKSNYSSTSVLETYFYKDEYKKIQCFKNRYRSFDDLLIIARTYYPEVTVEEVFKTLLLLNETKINIVEQTMGVTLSFCSTINRVRISMSKTVINYSHACTRRQGSSIYSWKELLSLININSQEDFINFYKTNTNV